MTKPPVCSREELTRLLEEQESSALSIAEFARQRGIAAHRLYWARRKVRESSKESEREVAVAEFEEVVVRDGASGRLDPPELRLPSGISIVVTRDFDEVTLRRLLGLLVPC